MIKEVSKTIENEVKEQEDESISLLLNTLGDSLLRNLLSAKGVKANREGDEVIRAGLGVIQAGDGTIKAGQDF